MRDKDGTMAMSHKPIVLALPAVCMMSLLACHAATNLRIANIGGLANHVSQGISELGGPNASFARFPMFGIFACLIVATEVPPLEASIAATTAAKTQHASQVNPPLPFLRAGHQDLLRICNVCNTTTKIQLPTTTLQLAAYEPLVVTPLPHKLHDVHFKHCLLHL